MPFDLQFSDSKAEGYNDSRTSRYSTAKRKIYSFKLKGHKGKECVVVDNLVSIASPSSMPRAMKVFFESVGKRSQVRQNRKYNFSDEVIFLTW